MDNHTPRKRQQRTLLVYTTSGKLKKYTFSEINDIYTRDGLRKIVDFNGVDRSGCKKKSELIDRLIRSNRVITI